MLLKLNLYLIGLWYILSIAQTSAAVKELELRMQMREETSSSTRIGSVLTSLPANLGSQLHFLTDSTFFTVQPNTGDIRVQHPIDRERLCTESKLCCGLVACELKASIFVTDKSVGELVASVLLKVEIQDQNDNHPIFAQPAQSISISESAPLGSFYQIQSATDLDIDPANQIHRYSLVEPSHTFELDVSQLPALRLKLIKRLDREQVDEYRATLEACDPGTCAKQTLEIYVLDENDNQPLMTNRLFRRQLIENTPVGTTVLELNATDLDSGDRGQVVYKWFGNVDPDLMETIDLDSDTGQLRLRRPLAANIRDTYEFKIVACDAANSNCLGTENSTAHVFFTVQDVNNYAPSIHVVPAGAALSPNLLELDANLNENALSILENVVPSQIAVIKVRDDDTNDNARVSCLLNHTNDQELFGERKNLADFLLTLSAPGIYSLRTARTFNFEVESTVRTTVVCHDFGQPQRLTSARLITVQIIDVNEFQPEFSRRVYIGRVPENAPAGKEILATTAIDQDREAVLRYKFAMPPTQLGDLSSAEPAFHSEDASRVGVNQYFVIEPETGIIRTSQIPLDRETISTVTLVVLVMDSIQLPIYTATTTVSIEVLDENDNAPEFINPPIQSNSEPHVFSVMENSPRFTQLDQKLEARDPDQGDNGRIQFSLLATYALSKSALRSLHGKSSSSLSSNSFQIYDEDWTIKDWTLPDNLMNEAHLTRYQVDQPKFRITANGGIETLAELDRESIPMYILKIGVRDRGAQALASTTLLHVRVLDANDNAPLWIFPSAVDRIVNLTTAMKPGSLAGRLRAEDVDQFDAGTVEYMFLGPRGEVVEGVSLEEGLLNVIANRPNKIAPLGPNVGDYSVDVKSRHHLKGYRVGPLYLNGSTGDIWITELLTASTINLHLRAQDLGIPTTHTDAWLTINVFVDPNESSGFLNLGGNGTLNITIILAMITVTAIISLFLIVGIICVRRRPVRYTMTQNATTLDGEVSPMNGNATYPMDINKEMMQGNMNSTGWSSPVGLYPTSPYIQNQPGQVMDEGQMFAGVHGPGGVMGYGAMMGSPNETGSMLYIPQGQVVTSNVLGPMGAGAMTPIPIELQQTNGIVGEYASRNQIHSFATMTRNRGGSVGPGVFVGPNGYQMAYEPHLDADSGDSGRGPSEEGHQYFIGDSYRNGGYGNYQYNMYNTYRPSSRFGYYRPVLENSGSLNKLHQTFASNANTTPSGTSSCVCQILSENPSFVQSGIYDQSDDYSVSFAQTPSTFDHHPSTGQYLSLSKDQSLPPLPPIRSPGSNPTLRRQHFIGRDNEFRTFGPNTTGTHYSTKQKPAVYYPNGIDSNAEDNNNNNSNGDLISDMPNKMQTPLKLDLRNHTASLTRFNNLTNNGDCFGQPKTLSNASTIGPGLPPLANKVTSKSVKIATDKQEVQVAT